MDQRPQHDPVKFANGAAIFLKNLVQVRGENLVVAIVRPHGFRLATHAGPGGRVDIVCPDRQQT